ncbi:protein of unknown function (DUF3596) [Cylindrospermum stagnale PCC 7417]|uniref:Min27-like integrase DNA-binding domain-containing protein n=1 Tax=Cylindrospermum stagnale PCC 7417 TaxID=56107 RepID=K9X453_9NOST|nr:DUF3596 domain-containing protein [Cylindrospermum stagnale]AFZ27435.1 protein of unknown function (DUF3596) [Cylindrospermum stagnale PCC 7417]
MLSVPEETADSIKDGLSRLKRIEEIVHSWDDIFDYVVKKSPRGILPMEYYQAKELLGDLRECLKLKTVSKANPITPLASEVEEPITADASEVTPLTSEVEEPITADASEVEEPITVDASEVTPLAQDEQEIDQRTKEDKWISIDSRSNLLALRFRVKGFDKQFFLRTGLEDTPANREKARSLRDEIKDDIWTGDFDSTLSRYKTHKPKLDKPASDAVIDKPLALGATVELEERMVLVPVVDPNRRNGFVTGKFALTQLLVVRPVDSET